MEAVQKFDKLSIVTEIEEFLSNAGFVKFEETEEVLDLVEGSPEDYQTRCRIFNNGTIGLDVIHNENDGFTIIKPILIKSIDEVKFLFSRMTILSAAFKFTQ